MRLVELPFERRTMANVLRDQAEAIGDDPFVLFEEERYSFSDADRVVDSYARGLSAIGVERGTNVAVMMENGPEFLWLTLALCRLGATFVPVNTAYKATFLQHVLGQAETPVVIADGQLTERVAEIERDLPALTTVVSLGDPASFERARVLPASELRRDGGGAVDVDVPAIDRTTILYTSGTTGPAKGAVISHNYWYVATMSLKDRRDVKETDVFYVCSPMFHAAAWVTQLYCALTLGLPVGIDRRFSVSDFWNRLRHYGASQLFTMAGTHIWLLNAPERPDDRDNPARVWAPVPLAPDLHEPFKERFGVEHLWFTYGQTEVMCITCTDTRKPFKAGSAGWARDEVVLAVVDDYDAVLPANEVGELVCRPTVPSGIMDGYWRQPDATLDAFKNLWYHTRDLARIDEDGEVFFVDRKGDYLRTRGENVSSFMVESAVGEHPAVAEVAALAVRIDEGDEDLLFVYTLNEGMSVEFDELARFCNERLPYFAMPRYLRVIDEFPRTPSGRVQKYLLREDGVTADTWDRVAAGFQVLR